MLKGNYEYVYGFGSKVIYNYATYFPRSRKLQIAGFEIRFNKKPIELYIFDSDQKASGFKATGFNKLLIGNYIIFYK